MEVRWNPGRFAVACAADAGLELPDSAANQYDAILAPRWPLFQQLNTERSTEVLDEFWREQTRLWLDAIGAPQHWVEPVRTEAEHQLYHTDQWFSLIPGTVEGLQMLKSKGHRLAVCSNWDRSLHRLIDAKKLSQYFEVVIASLEEGVEKPEPGIFQAFCERMNCDPIDVLHVGDDPIDDLQGAKSFGMHSAWLCPSASEKSHRVEDGFDRYVVRTLPELAEMLS